MLKRTVYILYVIALAIIGVLSVFLFPIEYILTGHHAPFVMKKFCKTFECFLDSVEK